LRGRSGSTTVAKVLSGAAVLAARYGRMDLNQLRSGVVEEEECCHRCSAHPRCLRFVLCFWRCLRSKRGPANVADIRGDGTVALVGAAVGVANNMTACAAGDDINDAVQAIPARTSANSSLAACAIDNGIEQKDVPNLEHVPRAERPRTCFKPAPDGMAKNIEFARVNRYIDGRTVGDLWDEVEGWMLVAIKRRFVPQSPLKVFKLIETEQQRRKLLRQLTGPRTQQRLRSDTIPEDYVVCSSVVESHILPAELEFVLQACDAAPAATTKVFCGDTLIFLRKAHVTTDLFRTLCLDTYDVRATPAQQKMCTFVFSDVLFTSLASRELGPGTDICPGLNVRSIYGINLLAIQRPGEEIEWMPTGKSVITTGTVGFVFDLDIPGGGFRLHDEDMTALGSHPPLAQSLPSTEEQLGWSYRCPRDQQPKWAREALSRFSITSPLLFGLDHRSLYQIYVTSRDMFAMMNRVFRCCLEAKSQTAETMTLRHHARLLRRHAAMEKLPRGLGCQRFTLALVQDVACKLGGAAGPMQIHGMLVVDFWHKRADAVFSRDCEHQRAVPWSLFRETDGRILCRHESDGFGLLEELSLEWSSDSAFIDFFAPLSDVEVAAYFATAWGPGAAIFHMSGMPSRCHFEDFLQA